MLEDLGEHAAHILQLQLLLGLPLLLLPRLLLHLRPCRRCSRRRRVAAAALVKSLQCQVGNRFQERKW